MTTPVQQIVDQSKQREQLAAIRHDVLSACSVVIGKAEALKQLTVCDVDVSKMTGSAK